MKSTRPAATEEETTQMLSKTLREHDVRAKFVTTYTGPTVTQYAYMLESGTRVRHVLALAEDLALAVGLPTIRVQVPIPGTSLVGLEVPRIDRETVAYGDFTAPSIQEESDMVDNMALPFPIGINIANQSIWADLTTLPHLLIAGATGSGKSVALSSMLTYLIENNTPAELGLWLIDPKRVELSVFANAPQVRRTVTEMSDAIDLLTEVEEEMDRRYNLFEEAGMKNIKEYNNGRAPDDQKLPYHVVAIDEMADLIMQYGKSVEPIIVRIAQLARAAGIHMVLATQRPTVNVVTGLIKNNVPSRWAFSVQGNKDSMVILDQPGAEKLYGAGDSLWLPAGSQDAIRVQSVWSSEAEVEKVVNKVDAAHGGPPPMAAPQVVDDDEEDEEPADAWFPADPAAFAENDTAVALPVATVPTVQVTEELRKSLIGEILVAMEEMGEGDRRARETHHRRALGRALAATWRASLAIIISIIILCIIVAV